MPVKFIKERGNPGVDGSKTIPIWRIDQPYWKPFKQPKEDQ